MKIETVIHQILNLLPTSKLAPGDEQESLVKLVHEDLPILLNEESYFKDFDIHGHAKMGVIADVPWIGFSPKNPKYDASPQTGVYLTILFSVDGSGFYVSIQHGSEHGGLMSVRKESESMRPLLKPKILTNQSINLLPTPVNKFGEKNYQRPKKYEAANLAGRFFKRDFSVHHLIESLIEGASLLESNGEFLMLNKVRHENLFEEPLDFDFNELPKKLVLPTIVKSFTILTGNSGTGKTRLAERLAETYRNADEVTKATNSALVAVGADWTDNRSVVGFVNHLRDVPFKDSSGKQPVYQSTPVLDLLLQADTDPNRPHFLILDEMNLSHVERYFADFLSAMESLDGTIRLHDEGPRDQEDFRLPRFEGDPVGVPRALRYPRNLFVIGTVNVDETTYMFSPKVLDRAHVIEFEVDSKEIKAFLDDPRPPDPVQRASAGQAEAFLQMSLRARGLADPLEDLPDAVKQSVNTHLIDLLEILQEGRFEFAFRTAKEVSAYMRVCRELADDKASWDEKGWKSDLDDEILQKILPRLHGSRTRIGPLLGALGSYLHQANKESARKFFPPPGEEMPERAVQEIMSLPRESADFPRSFCKIQQMVRIVVEEQFVSFIC